CAMAGIRAGTYTLGRLVAERVLWRGAGIADGIEETMPWSEVVSKIGAALLTTILIFFAIHFIARVTKRHWIAILLPGLLVGFMGIEPAFRPWIGVVQIGIVFSVLCWTAWRYGFLTAAIAFWASE